MSGTTLAVIIGRAGSKGLPGKNTRPIAGRPCAAWTIDDALDARRVDHIVVSTDCDRLASLSRKMGVESVARPEELAQDDTPVDAAVRHGVAEADKAGEVTRVVILYANVPVRPVGLIDRALTLMDETSADSVQSYAPVGKHHPMWTAVVEGGGSVRPWQGDVLNGGIFRRQDLPPAHVPDGGVIAVTREALFLELEGVEHGPHAFFGRNRRGVLTEEGEVVDIDGEIDALVCEPLLKRRMAAGVGGVL